MKINFVHIEKTAGTSFRGYLLSMFPNESFFWFSDKQEPFPEKEYFLYGGHKIAQEFDQNIDSSIMLSILRSPIERVKSLHRYNVQQIKLRSNNPQDDPYCLTGFDPYSISKSIIYCEDFRIRSSNIQTLAFCPKATKPYSNDIANQALEYILSRPTVIGLQENIDIFVKKLTTLWGWSNIFPWKNISFDSTDINSSKVSKKDELIIREICEQDFVLYEKLQASNGINNVSFELAKSVKLPPFLKKEDHLNISIKKTGHQFLKCQLDSQRNTIEVEVIIANNNPIPFGNSDELQINLSYHLLDAHGQILIYDGLRTSLEKKIHSNTEHKTIITIEIPNQLGTFIIEPALVIEGYCWLDHANGIKTKPFTLFVKN